jgi:hypothetical protein
MKTYTFSRTLADGSKKVEIIEAENLTQALVIYRQRVRDAGQ